MKSRPFIAKDLRVLLAVIVAATVASLSAAIPVINTISPNRGPVTGGTIVTITGTGFTGTTSVTFGGTAAAFTADSDTKITTTTPPKVNAGVVDVVVTNPDSIATAQDGFGYGNVPITQPDTFSTPFNTPLEIFGVGVLTNDNTNGGGTMVATLVSTVSQGTLFLNASGSFRYSPQAGFSGTDTFIYRATNDVGPGNRVTVTINVGAGPQSPSSLFASSVVANTVTLRWTPNPSSTAPTDHVVELGANPGEVISTLNTGSGFPIFTFNAPGGVFYYRVRAITGANQSLPSNEIRLFINVPVVPSAPASLTGVVNGSSVGLSWRNTFTGGAATSIVLDVTGSLVTSIPLGLADSFSFAGVPAGTYNLTLRGTNAAGSSVASGAITLTFPGPCSGPPQAPTNFLAYRVGNTLFAVWEPSGTGPASTSYVLNVSGSFVGSFATTGRSLSGTAGAGSYGFSVLALNACGASPATTVQNVVIP